MSEARGFHKRMALGSRMETTDDWYFHPVLVNFNYYTSSN